MFDEMSSSINMETDQPLCPIIEEKIVKDKEKVQAVTSQGRGDVHSCVGVE